MADTEKFDYSFFGPNCVRQTNFRMTRKQVRALTDDWKNHVDRTPAIPDTFDGRGIVINAGGIKYFTCAWINITLLRKQGCRLPIEIWYSGNELTAELTSELKELEVACIDMQTFNIGEMHNLALKPFSITNSRFREVLYLDADIVPVRDPSFLFDEPSYLQTGAIFWPDFWTTDKSNPIWTIIESKQYDTIEQDSGQILINKTKCWKELQLCLHFNVNFRHYYKILLGDKDTFKFAWQALKSTYYMIPTPAGYCGFRDPDGTFCGISMTQHGLDGEIIFIHRNWYKWDITRDDELLWMEIKSFRKANGERNMRFVDIYRGDVKMTFFDFDSDISTVGFCEVFGDLELFCLDVLKKLRSTAFFSRFLLHNYFIHYRPGYRKGFTGRLVSKDTYRESQLSSYVHTEDHTSNVENTGDAASVC